MDTTHRIALYRKYRPDSFNEVLGQDHIVSVLSSAVKEKRVAHAYLFSGPRGTGKTSVARILAKALDTEAHDLYEIDAASNRGIDEIRALREAVQTLPYSSPYKVYIIDEVHMLTKEAWNALLKTLEEPPSHIIFILATTELAKVPETIISRCQGFVFRKPSVDVLKKVIIAIAKKEGLIMEPEAAELIGILGGGSFRDAESIFEQVITATSGKKITEALTASIMGAPKPELVFRFLEAALSKNIEEGIAVITEASGADMKIFYQLVLDATREAMLFYFAPHLPIFTAGEIGLERRKHLEKIISKKEVDTLPQLLRVLLDSHRDLRYSATPQLPLELALISFCQKEI